MTTFYQFTPSISQIFQFQPTLDNQIYTISVRWNLSRRGWYVWCYDLSNNLIFSLPLIGSPVGLELQNLTWAVGLATGTTRVPHGLPIAATIAFTITGALPATYNGYYIALITGPSTFTYAIASNPGNATAYGVANQNTNLGAGYFDTSTLVFREASQNFEVSP